MIERVMMKKYRLRYRICIWVIRHLNLWEIGKLYFEYHRISDRMDRDYSIEKYKQDMVPDRRTKEPFYCPCCDQEIEEKYFDTYLAHRLK